MKFFKSRFSRKLSTIGAWFFHRIITCTKPFPIHDVWPQWLYCNFVQYATQNSHQNFSKSAPTILDFFLICLFLRPWLPTDICHISGKILIFLQSAIEIFPCWGIGLKTKIEISRNFCICFSIFSYMLFLTPVPTYWHMPHIWQNFESLAICNWFFPCWGIGVSAKIQISRKPCDRFGLQFLVKYCSAVATYWHITHIRQNFDDLAICNWMLLPC